MDQDQLLKEVNKIIIDVLDNKTIVLTRETKAGDIEEWDSLNHIQLVVAIEKKFAQRFTSAEITNWKNVGEMCNDLYKRMNK